MKPASGTSPNTLPVIAGLLSLLFLVNAMAILSRNAGLYHDELWDFIPAVGMIHGSSLTGSQEIRIFHYPLPLVTGPYHGALKTWTVAPLLALLGTSPRAILSLNVLFGMIYMLALYWALLPVAGRWAWVVFATPFVDTNFLFNAPMDVGPSLLQFIFIGLAMGALVRYILNAQPKYYRMIWFFAGCTLAQKLTSFPIVIGCLAVALVLAGRQLWEAAKSRRVGRATLSWVIFPAILFLIPLLPHLIYFHKSGLTDLLTMTADSAHVPYFAGLSKNFEFFRGMFDGTDAYQRITLDSVSGSFPPILTIFGLTAMSGSLILYFLSSYGKSLGRAAAAGVCVWICSFLLYPAFRGLNRPWHYSILTPVFDAACILAAVYCFSFLADLCKRFAPLVHIAVAAGLAAGVIAGAAHGIDLLRRVESRQGVCLTSPALYDACRAMEAADMKMIYAVNYSMAWPIYVLSKGAIQTEDLTWSDLTPEKTEELLQKIRANPRAGLAYRFCGCKEGDAGWIQWLNRDPQIFEFIKRVESERAALSMETRSDRRKTDFVLIRRRDEAR
jgi:hypothetical protein